MASYIQSLTERKLISPPSFLPTNVQYETIMGSVAYGVSNVESDMDIYGFCIPPKHIIFPHLNGTIVGFGKQPEAFQNFQIHHVRDERMEYDFDIYNIVHYFNLCMDNNPNIVDSLFTPVNCVLHCTQIGNLVRENRKMFLHKGSWHKRKGYAFSQLHKISNKNPVGKRKEIVETYGYDVKFAYHVIRLLNNAEQILLEGDLDLTRDREQLKSIRRGEWKEEDIRNYFTEKEKQLEKVYLESKLRQRPDEAKIKELLLNCLEIHYGNLDKCVIIVDKASQCLQDIKKLIDKYTEK
jgi:predicted nucleotidyltransferase